MLLLCALCALWPAAAHGAADTVFSLDGHIRHFAATPEVVFVATEQSLYQLSPDLTLVRRVSQRGVFVAGGQPEDANFVRVSERGAWNTTFSVNVMLPYVANNSLVLCGVLEKGCGYCELLMLRDVSTVIYSESFLLGPVRHDSASVAFLVTVEGASTETYILTATESDASKEQRCSVSTKMLSLHNTINTQFGGIFSINDRSSTPQFTSRGDRRVDFVDGFQVDSVIYLFSNVFTASASAVRVLWLEAEGGKAQTMKSIRGATLSAGARARLLTSSVITGTSPLTWSGVFSVDGSRANTELLLFDISPDFRLSQNNDPDFCSGTCTVNGAQPKTLKPLKVLLKQRYMSSVLALKRKAWLLFFIGTTDGQLIKFAVDKNYHSSCPRVLYRANDDREVLKLNVDEDRKHVYVAFTNQILRIPVSRCSTHTSLLNCWSAQDPLCVWCNSTQSCTFESDCKKSAWLSISEDLQQEKVVSYKTENSADGQITLKVRTHVTVGPDKPNNFACQFSLQCSRDNPPPQFPECTCILSNSTLPAQGLEVTVKIRLWTTILSEKVKLIKCPDIRGPPSTALCRECIEAGCGWSSSGCSWANEASTNKSVCQKKTEESGMNYVKPEISSVHPSVVSFYGRNHAVMTGRNLSHVTRVRIQADMDCIPRESPVWSNTGVNLTFHIPSSENKGVVKVCAVLPDGSCHSNATITYRSSPSCTAIKPSHTWLSGGRSVTLIGSHMEFVEAVVQSHALHTTHSFQTVSSQNRIYTTVPAEKPLTSTVYLRVANETLNCSGTITYHPNPVFTSYTSIRTGGDASITIQKKADQLDIRPEELSVWAVGKGKEYPCIMESIETNNETDFYTCEIKNTPNAEFEHLMITFGETTVMLKPESSYLLLILLVLLLIPCIIMVVVIVYRKKQNQLTTQMNQRMENLELDIRNDIRQGFIDLQIEKANLLENVGTIPFLDYKHFASRIFFPESEALMKSCIKDIGQDREMVQLDECCEGLSKLIRDQLFLTSMVHALEEQKSFSIKDKCVLASVLTVALHSDLWYLTKLMEVLLKDLMQQSSNTQPKLLLRRTESTVEKLLTNWMSICLYGFLRESVGQHLFLMVSALTQQISKGPVDCVTEKALYTLSEDWLLWQAQDFDPLKLKVLFAVGSDGELSEPLEVDALTCDTVDQVKEKILSTFRAKFGFPYNIPIRDLCIEFVRDGACLRLEEVDSSSEVMGEVTMLNTMKHYKIPDGATIKVLSRKSHAPLSAQESVKDDQDFSGKYFHLIDPDVVEDQKSPERKKLKLKEVHLTKLLSTKVAVHSFVENLFRCIWGMQYNKPPLVVKYFFDFLDAQAEDMKITDPDVLHIWKTNSLPLRFWVNILKNPQFVFDLEKSPHVDGCLSVVAQAFMDSFSLSDIQLGKHTPTNKLLYAKEIPKFKQEVKVYYKQIQEQQPVTETEFKAFLQKESKKHENEFNEAAALKELYKFIQRYFTEIQEKLDQNGAPSELKEQLHHLKNLFDGLKSCSWN